MPRICIVDRYIQTHRNKKLYIDLDSYIYSKTVRKRKINPRPLGWVRTYLIGDLFKRYRIGMSRNKA